MAPAIAPHTALAPTEPRAPAIAAGDAAARADLRRQIAALERSLGELFASSFPRRGLEWGVGAAGGPRVLGLGELERVRDALAARLHDTRAELARRADREEAKRAALEEIIAAPHEHRWEIVSNEDIGERGCRHWHARPRWGILGMLLGWWRVKVSSGCPLAEGPRPPPPRTPMAKKRRKPRPRRPAPTPGEAAPEPARARPARAPIDDTRPPAPWGSFPLVELVVLVALVMLGFGFFGPEDRRDTFLIAGIALGSLAGLELSIREHFGGFRSHTTLLAAAPAVLVMIGSYEFTELPVPACIGAGAVVGLVSAWLLVRAFRNRSGRAVKLR